MRKELPEYLLMLTDGGGFARVLFPPAQQHLVGETSYVVQKIQELERQKKEQVIKDRLNYGAKANGG